MIIGVKHTISLLKSLFIELFLNKTDKVTDISDSSVVNATAFGVAKVAQKCLKDIAIVESRLLPETASGEDLDIAAELFGVPPRNNTALGSSTYVLVAIQGNGVVTDFLPGMEFLNVDGVRFTVEENNDNSDPNDKIWHIGADGNNYGYVKVSSQSQGSFTNVAPNTIVNMVNPPVRFIACTNEYYAIGGRDIETDEQFRVRIKNNPNILSMTTREYFTQIFQRLDDRVLKLYNFGINSAGNLSLKLATVNGAQFTQEELGSLLEQAAPYFPLSDKDRYGNVVGIVLENIDYYFVGGVLGVEFRIEIQPGFTVDDVRRNIQINLTKYFDFNKWTDGGKVEWDDLLQIVKNTSGVKYVPDEYFNPSIDEYVPFGLLPRIKQFKMLDLQGGLLFDTNNQPLPIFYAVEDE